MTAHRIAVLGATGGIGRDVAQWLAQSGYRLRVGARQPVTLRQLAQRLDAEACAFDLYQQDALAAFCRGCALVVNCAGPSYQVLDRVAVSAARAGAHYIDVSGDGPVWHLLQQALPGRGNWTAVLSAGMLPGLANLIPSWLSPAPGGCMTVYSGGIEQVRGAAAADLVLSLNAQCGELESSGYWYGAAGGYWLNGERSRQRLPIVERDEQPHFSGHVTLLPFLSGDAERLARSRELDTLRWYNVFSGHCLREVLTGIRGRVHTPEQLAQAVRSVEQASSLDTLGLTPYYRLVFDLTQCGKPCRRAVIATDSSLALTAAVTVSAVNALLRGEIAPGIHYADQVLGPAQTLNDVVRLHQGTRVCQYLPDECEEVGAL